MLTGCVVIVDGNVDVIARACIFSRHLVHARRYRTVPAGFSPVHSLGLSLTFRIAVWNCTEQCRVANGDANCVQLSLSLCVCVCVYIHTHISFHLMKNAILPAEFAALIAADVTLLLGCDAVKFGVVKARAASVFRAWWLM